MQMDHGAVLLRQGLYRLKQVRPRFRSGRLGRLLQREIPLFRLAADITGTVKGGSDQPRFLMSGVPE